MGNIMPTDSIYKTAYLPSVDGLLAALIITGTILLTCIWSLQVCNTNGSTSRLPN